MEEEIDAAIQANAVNRISEDVEPVKQEYRTIKINVEKITGMTACFTATDVTVEIGYKNAVLGVSEKVPMTDEIALQISFDAEMKVWPTDVQALNDLISNPLYFTVRQTAGEQQMEILSTKDAIVPEVIDLEEILGVLIEEPVVEEAEKPVKKKKSSSEKKSNGKGKKHSEKTSDSTSKKDKDSKKSRESKKDKDSKRSTKGGKSIVEGGEKIVGLCSMDVGPFLLGETKIIQALTLQQDVKFMDERLITHGNLPVLHVQVSIDFPIFDEEYPLGNIMKFTVESIYNLPQGFDDTLKYTIATIFPQNKTLETTFFERGTYTNEFLPISYKKWENLIHLNNKSCFTNEEIVKKPEGIKNKLKVNLEKCFEDKLELNDYKVEWNILKRCWLDVDLNEKIRYRLIRHRKWPLELSITKHDHQPKGDAKKTPKKSSKFEAMHFMSFVDVSNLLYPGVKKVRAVAELRTYQEFEMEKETGINQSLFISKPDTKKEEKEKPKKEGKKGKDTKDTKSVKNKKSLSPKQKYDTMAEVMVDPSTVITNPDGEPTFIIIEIELLKPLYEKRTLQDYTSELRSLLPIREPMPMYVISKELCTLQLDECMKSVITRLCKDYQSYMFRKNDKKILFSCPKMYTFHEYLLSSGNYQEYMNSLLKIIGKYVSEHFDIQDAQKTQKKFENFVSSLYVHLVCKMNKILNGPITCGLEIPKSYPKHFGVSYVYRAREAEEMGAIALAERYHNEQISRNSENANVWLNFAVFQLALKNRDRAYECVKECLALELNHKYGLLLYAVMLFIRKEWYYSETTFLTLLNYYPRYVEGWVCLYVFYLARENHAGCDVCEERIDTLSNIDVDESYNELFNEDDIVWTTEIYPKENKFFQTCMVLLKLRAVSFAELTLGYVPFPESGELKYYNAVLRYLTQDYNNALLYLKQARKEHGPDFAVNSLIGHCYYKLGEYDKAKEAYEFVVYLYNRPDDMHMLYLNLAFIYDRENNLPIMKKYLLHVCKYSPTAYDWLLLGICFFKEESWTFAEECLTEANLQDNYLPETWAYLTLLNLKIGKPWVASQCYDQILKYDLQNDALLQTVESEMRKEK